MLRMYMSTAMSDAKRYYTEALAQEDYYTRGRETIGLWHGEAAKLMGLEGQVDQKAFAHLCENRHPISGERLTKRTRDDRTVGYDMNFHAPKGVSLLHAMTGDERIVEAMRASVQETMLDLEQHACARVRKGGRDEDRATRNLAWGEFIHYTARPVDGVPDPHLHVHCFVMNATFDHAEQQWKAGQFRSIVQDHPYLQAAFHTRLAGRLNELGYTVAREGDVWDLKGIDRELVEKFSRRTKEIEEEARRRGIKDPKAKGELGAKTRKGKDKHFSAEELRARWREQMSAEESEWLDGVGRGGREGSEARSADADRSGHDRRTRTDKAITAREAVNHAVQHVFERSSVECERRLAAEAMKYGVGHVQPEQVWAEFAKRNDLLSREEGGRRWVTTRTVLEEERAVLRFAVDGKGEHLPLGQGLHGREGEAYEVGSTTKREGITLNEHQSKAVEQVLGSRDRVQVLRGGAGTGKTTLLKEAAAGIRHGGSKVFAFAVTSDASRGVLREVGFEKADTLERLLTNPQLQDQVKGQVVWVDEAGMVGTPTMRRLFKLAERQDCRVILSGDSNQHPPVERGDAMRLLEHQAGIKPAEVDHIVRQKGLYRDAVEAMTKGELTKSVKLIDEMGALKEMDDPSERGKALADEYVEAVKAKRSALVVSPTHAEGKEVTGHIREALRESGRIGKEDTSFTRLRDRQWTDAQKADVARYEVGDVIQFTQNCRGVPQRDIPPAAAGLKAKVISIDRDRNLVLTEDAAGHRRPLPLTLGHRFGVFKEEQLGLAQGDTIRITKNARTLEGKRLNNGSMYKVKGFTKDGDIRLDNKGKWVVSKHMGHLNHGYCTTPQAAQGKSVDLCLASIAAHSLTASSLQQLYVILSRGKKGVTLLTDRRSAFIDAVSRLHRSRSAMELFAEPGNPGVKTRQQQMMAHAREVGRLKAFEQARRHRQQTMHARQQRSQQQQHGQQQRTGPQQGGTDRSKQTGSPPASSRKKPPTQRRRPPGRGGRDGPARDDGPAKER